MTADGFVGFMSGLVSMKYMLNHKEVVVNNGFIHAEWGEQYNVVKSADNICKSMMYVL